MVSLTEEDNLEEEAPVCNLSGTGAGLGPKNGLEAYPSMCAGSTEELERGKCGVEGAKGSSQTSSSPGCLA